MREFLLKIFKKNVVRGRYEVGKSIKGKCYQLKRKGIKREIEWKEEKGKIVLGRRKYGKERKLVGNEYF